MEPVTLVVILACVALAVGLTWLLLGRQPGVNAGKAWIDAPKEKRTQFVEKRQAILKVLAAERDSISQSRLLIKHIMTFHPATVSPEASTKAVAEIMRKKECRHSIICDEDLRLLGVVSDRDVHTSMKRPVADVMTRDPRSVSPDSLVSAAVTIMLDQQISSLPVVTDDGRVCGVVTTTDMMMTLQCMLRLAGEDESADEPTDDAVECVVAGDAAL